MTEEQKELIRYSLKRIRDKFDYNVTCHECFKKMFPSSYPPVIEEFLFDPMIRLITYVSGLSGIDDDFWSWYIFECIHCNDFKYMEIDGVRYDIKNDEDAINVAEILVKRENKV